MNPQTPTSTPPPLLEVKSLQKRYPLYGPLGRFLKPKSHLEALTDVSFHLNENEVYGLVGESGSGKSTTARVILGLTPPDTGQVIYQGKDLMQLSPHAFRKYRKDLQLVFQDPFSSLNPRKRIGAMLEEPLVIHQMGNAHERREKVFHMLQAVGLQPEHYYRYPHEFSGGQRQRLGLARALMTEPKILICDEPVSALDVSIQAHILKMLMDLKERFGLTILFITHDLSVVRHISDRIGVMQQGILVEEAPTDTLFVHPTHAYTQKLFQAIPSISRPRLKERLREEKRLQQDFS